MSGCQSIVFFSYLVCHNFDISRAQNLKGGLNRCDSNLSSSPPEDVNGDHSFHFLAAGADGHQNLLRSGHRYDIST